MIETGIVVVLVVQLFLWLELSRRDRQVRDEIGRLRESVEQKLQGTLETSLNRSFRLVSERLEQVHLGLGEMRNLAAGVGDLKRVLTNVKTRGVWGEVQLAAILEEILTPSQYERNVATTGTGERVEFAVKLPGRETNRPCWLPIDSKFPTEDYQRFSDATDPASQETAARALEATARRCARSISDKYLLPPNTTDFAILFVPTEGLYAELLRRPGLAEKIQHDYRVILAGPNTFAAILNSLQMGFQTLEIQQRSSEVWEILAGVKAEFARYAGVLATIRKRLQQATQTVDEAETRTRAVERKLRSVDHE
jgi:DNA recombination protein RmuC